MNADLREFIQKSQNHLSSSATSTRLKEEQHAVISEIEKILKKDAELKNYMLNGRVKKPESLKEKIIRKADFFKAAQGDAVKFIDQILDDIIGIRIICLLNDDEDQTYQILKSHFSKEHVFTGGKYFIADTEEDPTYPYLAYSYEDQPVQQRNGKDIYKLKLKYITGEDTFTNIELQIKSLTHMFWGELEHMLFYKNYKFNLDNDFHSKLMGSIDTILETLNAQLKDLKGHLSKNDKLKETKNMVTKILYNKFHESIKKIHDTELDLREVYGLISQLYFYECSNYQESLQITQKILSKVTEIQFSDSEFDFSTTTDTEGSIEDFKIILDNYIKEGKLNQDTPAIFEELAKNIEIFSKETDIFWCCLLVIHTKLSIDREHQGDLPSHYQNSLVQLTYMLLKTYMGKYINDIEIEDSDETPLNLSFINNCILKSLIECFHSHKKMDFFLEDIHQENIINIIRKFLESFDVNEPILSYGATPNELEKISSTMVFILKLQVQYYLNRKVDLQIINEIKNNVTTLADVDFDFNIDSQQLALISEGKTKITDLKHLQHKIYFN